MKDWLLSDQNGQEYKSSNDNEQANTLNRNVFSEKKHIIDSPATTMNIDKFNDSIVNIGGISTTLLTIPSQVSSNFISYFNNSITADANSPKNER